MTWRHTDVHTTVGAISEINRYPIKSFAGERLDDCEIAPYGVEGDRYASFRDENKEGWWQYVTARNIPAMMSYQARYIDGEIEVVAPDGRRFGWDEQLLAEIQNLTKTPITMSELGQAHPQPEHAELLSVDGGSVLLVTDATMRKLEATWGKEVDQRRFRGNFVVAVNDDAPLEEAWIGKKLTIGDAELQAHSFCERCVMITMDPDTLTKDPSLLKKVVKEFNQNFGIYASVIKTGKIRVGDKVRLSDAEVTGD